MDERIIPFIIFFIIIVGWIYIPGLYRNLFGKEQRVYLGGEKFKDEFGDHFAEDIKKLVKYVEDLPKENQINIYEHVVVEFGNYSKVISKVRHTKQFDRSYNKYIFDVENVRRKNAHKDSNYKNPKWLATTIYESLLRSESNKMTYNNGSRIRKYLLLKMKELIPNNKTLKFLLEINGFQYEK